MSVSDFSHIYYFLIIKSADICHTLHGLPQTTTKYGKSAPIFGEVPILVVALYLWWWLWSYRAICLGTSYLNPTAKLQKSRDDPFNIGRLFVIKAKKGGMKWDE